MGPHDLGSRYPVLDHEHDPDSGQHTVHSPNGSTIADDMPNGNLKVVRSDTNRAGQGQGEGTARIKALAETAHARGGDLVSDVSVSPAQAAVYEKLRNTYDVRRNPGARLNRDTGNIISNDIREPVYTVKPKPAAQRPLSEILPGQRGGPKRGEPKEETAPQEPDASVNIGLHVGDPANGGRVMKPEEAIQALKDAGARVGKTSIVQSGTEPTLVADIHSPFEKKDLHALSAKLGQGSSQGVASQAMLNEWQAGKQAPPPSPELQAKRARLLKKLSALTSKRPLSGSSP
jgi:hypothetical protein